MYAFIPSLDSIIVPNQDRPDGIDLYNCTTTTTYFCVDQNTFTYTGKKLLINWLNVDKQLFAIQTPRINIRHYSTCEIYEISQLFQHGLSPGCCNLVPPVSIVPFDETGIHSIVWTCIFAIMAQREMPDYMQNATISTNDSGSSSASL